jgi:hypothetical protein
LRHRKRLVGRPAPPLAAGLLQGGKIEEAWRRLPLLFNRDTEWSLMSRRGLCDRLCTDEIFDPINGSWLVCIWRESPHYQEHDARTF